MSDVILSPADQVYLEKVRMATRRFQSGVAGPSDLRPVVQALRDVSSFDVEVPTASQHREWELVKVGVKRLSVWYMRYLAEQLNNFGANVSRLGEALAQRMEALEHNDDELAARVGAAEARLARLEAMVLLPATAVQTVPQSTAVQAAQAPAAAQRPGGARTERSRQAKGAQASGDKPRRPSKAQGNGARSRNQRQGGSSS